MAYNKDSGESRLRKDANPGAYINRKNRNIFKSSQTAQTSPKPQRKINYEQEVSGADTDTPHTGFESNEKHIPEYKKTEPRRSYEYERQREKESESERETLSFKDIIGIIVANGFVPIIGGFIFYIALSSQGKRQKAAQSIVLSAIVSIIRIMFIING
ncbi:MAG: hypothetical protein LBQ01_06020 [Prevotellaceae bacterium]|jgi:hypothetical protein|nr:hypothetical protein [Prevotellaceae bacterium]